MQARDTTFRAGEGPQPARIDGRGSPRLGSDRQRAWGVPIALVVERKTGELLVDAEVNARIAAAVPRRPASMRGRGECARIPRRGAQLPTITMIADILDVWFDSGCTHVFTLESGHWPEERWPADLYLEGSDRTAAGSSRRCSKAAGRAAGRRSSGADPRFTMDSKGMKMSKSLAIRSARWT